MSGLILDLAADASITTTRLRDRLNTIQLERGALEEKLAMTTAQLERGARLLEVYLQLLGDPAGLFSAASDDIRRVLLQVFFSRILVGFDGPIHGEQRELVSEIQNVAKLLSDEWAREPVSEKENRRTDRSAVFAGKGPLTQFFFYQGLSKGTLAGKVTRYSNTSLEHLSAALIRFATPVNGEKSLVELEALLARIRSSARKQAEPSARIDDAARRLGPRRVSELVAKYDEGSTAQVLAAEFDVGVSTVLRLVRSRGGKVRGHGITDEDRAEACRLYSSGLSVQKVTEQVGG